MCSLLNDIYLLFKIKANTEILMFAVEHTRQCKDTLNDALLQSKPHLQKFRGEGSQI